MSSEAVPTVRRWRREWLLPLVLAVATSAWMLAVEGRQGIGRDGLLFGGDEQLGREGGER